MLYKIFHACAVVAILAVVYLFLQWDGSAAVVETAIGFFLDSPLWDVVLGMGVGLGLMAALLIFGADTVAGFLWPYDRPDLNPTGSVADQIAGTVEWSERQPTNRVMRILGSLADRD